MISGFFSCSALQILPSYLRRRERNEQGTRRQQQKNKKPKVVKTWDRDILCIPKGGRRTGGGISFPRGRFRAYLARSGLIGKLHLTSEMSDQDVEDEIRTIFRGPMLNNSSFPFLYLQSTGGGSKTLTIPSQSSSFKWTPQQVAHLSGHSGTIYILAQEDLYEIDDAEVDEVMLIYIICISLTCAI